MEESVKNRLILILAILAVIFFIGTIGSCANTTRMKSSRDSEMVKRLDLEEKMSKFTQEKNLFQERLKNATQALDEEKTAHEATKKELYQEKLVNQSLKEELAKVAKLKEALEEDLKEALAGAKSKSRK